MKFSRFLRISFVAAIFVSVCAVAMATKLVAQSTGKSAQRPNIVLLFVDDLGWNDLGYRNAKFETPNIDLLASTSVDLQRAYVPNPACSPSRAGLLTGQQPVRLGLFRHVPTTAGRKSVAGFDRFGRTDQEWALEKADPGKVPSRNWLPLECTTYAEALGDLGYTNHFVGKWHLGHEPYHPNKQGFNTQFGTTNYGHPKSYNAPFFVRSDVLADVTQGHLTDTLTQHSVDLIKQHDGKNPFMLSLWYYGVHRPPIGRPDLVKHYLDKGYEKSEAIYAAQVKAVDESVGQIRTALTNKGIEKNTVIIFCSDQGSYYSNAPLRGDKRVDTLHEGGTRVPLLISYPDVWKSRQSTVPVQTLDLFPTLVEIAGGDCKKYENLDGVSLLPVLKGADSLKGRALLVTYRAYKDRYASVRQDNWNFLAYRSGKVGLYDTEKDIAEQHDVADQFPEVVQELTAKLVAWEKRMNVQQYSGFPNHMADQEQTKAQKAN